MLSLTATGTPSSAPGVGVGEPIAERRGLRSASSSSRQTKTLSPSRPASTSARGDARVDASSVAVSTAARRVLTHDGAASARSRSSVDFVRRQPRDEEEAVAHARARTRRASARAESAVRVRAQRQPARRRRRSASCTPRRCPPSRARPCARGWCSARATSAATRSSVEAEPRERGDVPHVVDA